ncbi:MAG: MAPEG family protein [Candidatus Binatia bacterium]|nr:MAPEG family protein [Candidatus Binatia bacterium]
MEPFLGNPAFRTYAVCVAILVIKMIASAVYTASQRSRVKGYVNPEDALVAGGAGVTAAEAEQPDVARALRIQRNDLENIPLFFAIGLVYVLLGASPLGATAYFWLFTVSRILHTLVYIRNMQPARAIFWGIGVLCLVGMSVATLWNIA